jgi:xylono-1,5-lactonase
MAKIECIWDAKAELGEGVRYDAATQELWWVDILGQKIFCLDLSSGKRHEWPTPETVGCTLPDGKGGVLALFRHSLVRLDRATGQFEHVLGFKDEPANNRFNDGTVAPDGSLWLGSMDFDFTAASGKLYRVILGKDPVIADSNYIVVNGPAISPDSTQLYVNETMKGQIFSFDMNPSTGEISNKSLFVQFAEGKGLPDGIHVDRQGRLWVAVVTGSVVQRYLSNGKLDTEIKMPSPIVTSVCIGPDDNTLFVTTGRILMDEATLAAHPLSGGLFKVTLG